MQEDEYRKMYELEENYWWFVGRRAILRRILTRFLKGQVRKAVDVGCGTGMNLRLLGEFSQAVVGLDRSAEALRYCKARGQENVILVEDAARIPFETATIELVTLLDVLEHVDDDEKVLQELFRVLQPGGLLILTVPAYQFLWSEHDEALHHRRRYTRREITHKARSAGFEILRGSYLISALLPLIIVYRALKGVFNFFSPAAAKTSYLRLPGPLNEFFVFLLRVEGFVSERLSLPFGTSVIVVATKRGDGAKASHRHEGSQRRVLNASASSRRPYESGAK